MKKERILSYAQSRELSVEELAGVSGASGTSYVTAIVTTPGANPDCDVRINYDF